MFPVTTIRNCLQCQYVCMEIILLRNDYMNNSCTRLHPCNYSGKGATFDMRQTWLLLIVRCQEHALYTAFIIWYTRQPFNSIDVLLPSTLFAYAAKLNVTIYLA